MQEQSSSPPMRAAIDIGSNTIHIVVARCKPDDLDIVEDQLELVRIGESVTTTGVISPEKCDATVATLRKFEALARQHNAEPILVVATEAIRQAHNSQQFLEHIQHQTGLLVHLISGTAEATLTFYGATYEVSREPASPKRLGVMDLGGGSIELVTAKNLRIDWRISLPIGSGWLHDRYLSTNPPTLDDLAVAQTFLQTYLAGIRIKWQSSTLIVTGGSANSLLLLARRAFRLDPTSSKLTYDDLMHCEGLMAALTAEEISQRYGQPLARARILPAGALIIRTVMSRLNLGEISVSPHGIREGVLLAYERFGENWLERVNEEDSTSNHYENTSIQQALHPYEPISRRSGSEVDVGRDTYPPDRVPLSSPASVQPAFIDTGKRMLEDRVDKLLAWTSEVLKHEDIEAVHKMRVATRRLRATLDAFESCCEPKQFKKTYRHIKKIADLLGDARDTDVMLQGLHVRLEQAPAEERAGIQWLIQRLDVYRQQKQKALEDFFATLDQKALRKQVTSCIQEEVSHHGKSQTHPGT